MMECGTKLMATRNEETDEWDGRAAIAVGLYMFNPIDPYLERRLVYP
jgi:hypothetical protein